MYEEREVIKNSKKSRVNLGVCLKIWEWEHENWIEERELEVLSMNKDETTPEWIDPPPRLREDVLVLKRLAAPEKPAVKMCQALDSMTDFYLLGDAIGQGFGSGLWD